MTNEKWTVDKALLERKLLDAKALVHRYNSTLKPYRDVTESEYTAAKAEIWRLSTEISEGDYEANKPADPFGGKTAEELEEMFKTQADALINTPEKARAERLGVGIPKGRVDSRSLVQITRLSGLIQAAKAGEVE